MDAVVELVISKVAQTVEENATLILGIKDQGEDLLGELRSFRTYLSEAAKNENCNDKAVLKEAVQKIQKVGTDAEDAIDKYLVNEAAKEMESIKKRAEKIRVDLAHSLQGSSLNNPQPPPPVLRNLRFLAAC
nr:putative late blight resistance protein homolog R1B-14 [Ipomoea batatas]